MDRRAAGNRRVRMSTLRRIPMCLVLAVVVALACAAPSLAHGPGVRAWLTTGDQASLLAGRPPAARGAPAPAAPTIAVDPTRSYQRIEGLGASITDSSAHLLARSPDRDAIMGSLFSPHGGLGLSYLRQPMGASDFVAGPPHTYNAAPAAHTALRLRHLSIAHDRAEILPLLRQALRLNPNLKVMATPWSPP